MNFPILSENVWTTAEATYKNAKKSTSKPPYKRPEDRDLNN